MRVNALAVARVHAGVVTQHRRLGDAHHGAARRGPRGGASREPLRRRVQLERELPCRGELLAVRRDTHAHCARLRDGRRGAVDMGVAAVEVEVVSGARALDVGVGGGDEYRGGGRAEAVASEATRVVVAAREVVAWSGLRLGLGLELGLGLRFGLGSGLGLKFGSGSGLGLGFGPRGGRLRW